MTMNVGDVVNIMKYKGGYWKGEITSVSDRYNETMKYQQPIAIVRGIGNPGLAAVMEKDLRREDEEWFEVRK